MNMQNCEEKPLSYEQNHNIRGRREIVYLYRYLFLKMCLKIKFHQKNIEKIQPAYQNTFILTQSGAADAFF